MYGWDPTLSYPTPPTNVFVVSPYLQGVLDIRWDDPSTLAANTNWIIAGVNVYRSDASDRGPFRRLNTYPVGGTFYRDSSRLIRVESESVEPSSWVSRGNAANMARWTFRTVNPIYKPGVPLGVHANAPTDVYVTVDGVPARVISVFGSTGEVTIDTTTPLDPRVDRDSPAPLPSPDSAVTVSYYMLNDLVLPGVDKRAHYRVTTVAVSPGAPGGYVETPLPYVPPATDRAVETVDYIWREAMRRNRWILEQGGERVKLFVQRVGGAPCRCDGLDPQQIAYNKQPSNRCRICWGVGFVGGYDGPYEIIVAPDDGERRISQSQQGRRKEHSYEVWMPASPEVSQRDFIVKQNNERFSIGPVRRPTNRGNLLQQHFQLQYLDSQDIRYSVPIDGTQTSPTLPWPQTRYSYSPYRETYDRSTDTPWPVGPDAAMPMASETGVEDPQEVRARTGAGANILYGKNRSRT